MTLLPSAKRRSTAAVTLAVGACLTALAWTRPLLLPDEGRYVGVAWEMLRSGDWLTPTLNGLPYFHKPPLFYWITAASMGVFGPGEWSARLAPLIGSWLAAMAGFVFTRRWWGERAAWLALVSLLSMPLFYLGGQFANMDMLVAGLITAAIAMLAHAALEFEAGLSHRRAVWLGYALAGLAILAKGLIGAVLPALVIAGWLVGGRRWRTARALCSGIGALMLLLIAAPWFLAMQARFPQFVDYFFVVQHFKRYATGGFNNVQPWWYYPAVLLVFSLPWLRWLGAQLGRGRRSDPEHDDVRHLAMWWLVVVVGFFSLPRSKLLGYVLPALLPLALLIADGVQTTDVRVGTPSQRAWLWACCVGAAISVAAVATFALHPTRSTREIANVLRQKAAPGEPVVMIGGYWFDLPQYAHLREPVTVVDDWSRSDVQHQDNWRKELADAGTFAPSLAAARLVEPAVWCAGLAGVGSAWVVGHASATSRFDFLTSAAVVAQVRGTTLWRVDRADPHVKSGLCEGTPSGDRPSK